jgi:hypothetical protein
VVSHWASIRLPSCSRFRKPPCDPEHRDFPDSVLTLAFPLQAFPTTTKLKCWHTCTPLSLVYLADWSLWWLIPVSQLTDLEPPSAQSPFAPCRRYLDGEDVLRLLERHYPSFIAHTDSCAKPLPSLRFQVTPLFERSLQVACQPLLRKGSSQRYRCRPSLRAGTPTPAAPKVLSPVSSPGTLAFPERTRVSAWLLSIAATSDGEDFGAAVIPLRSGPQVCSPHR